MSGRFELNAAEFQSRMDKTREAMQKLDLDAFVLFGGGADLLPVGLPPYGNQAFTRPDPYGIGRCRSHGPASGEENIPVRPPWITREAVGEHFG